MNFEKIERAGHVQAHAWILPDLSVATAIGALAPGRPGRACGHALQPGGYRRISLFVDEVSNVINQPLIEILNKGAEGGIFTTCAMQTLADLAKRLGKRRRGAHGAGQPEQPDRAALRRTGRRRTSWSRPSARPRSTGTRPEQRRRCTPGRLLVELLDAAHRKLSRRWCRPTCWAKLPNRGAFASVSGGGSSRVVSILDPDAGR